MASEWVERAVTLELRFDDDDDDDEVNDVCGGCDNDVG